MIISTTIMSPCKNCTDRCIGCHTTCGDYAEYKQELERRRKEWVCPEPKIKTGYIARYAKLVTSADKGAVLI